MRTSSHPLLTVIIPALNEAETLPALLKDLHKQNEVSLEIIIGDGGSVDATRSVAESFDVQWVRTASGRGAQMNAAVQRATGDYYLFVHADSRIDDPDLLGNALEALRIAESEAPPAAGHFCLRFMRSTKRNSLAYRYIEAKTALNRPGTTNGDQGLLLAAAFFRHLGGFDQSLPFLEDQRIAEKIRSQGRWITLPGVLKTSARRFESEGFHRRYLLMSMMMGLYSINELAFFERAPGVYRQQQETGKLRLSPFLGLIWQMIRQDWGLAGTFRIFYRLGRYIRRNSWQPFFWADVALRPLLGPKRSPLLRFHDRIVAPCTDLRILNALTGLLCFIYYMVILASFFRLTETMQPRSRNRNKPV